MSDTTQNGSSPLNMIVGLSDKAINLLNQFPDWPLQLFARFSVGYVFYNSGMKKVYNCDFPWFSCKIQDITYALFKDFDVPFLSLVTATKLATFGELTLPLLLFAGLATRFGAAGLLVMTMVIQIVQPTGWPTHLMWATLLVFVLVRGPGPVSVDHFVRKRFIGN